MLTTTQAFEKFRKRLELSDTEQRDAAKRHKEVRGCIRGEFDIKRDFLFGSYSRHTKTKPLKDVDIMFVLSDEEKVWRNKPPIDMLRAFERCLKNDYSDEQVSIDNRSVTVEFEKNYYAEGHEGKILSIDAVPAFEFGGGTFEIPDETSGDWIKTNPEKHSQLSSSKNDEIEGHWVPLVKMAKSWNRANGDPIKPSFLVEVMSLQLVDSPFSNYPDEIRNLFATTQATIDKIWYDPAGLGPPVSDQMTSNQNQKAKNMLREAQRKATLARREEENGRLGGALQIWRDILGPYFPLS